MHASFQELISFRDGEPVSADAAQHIAHCEPCKAELARLQQLRTELRRLPAFEPQPHWNAIRDRLNPAPEQRPRRIWLNVSMTAAGVLLALSLLWSLKERAPSNDSAQNNEAALRPLVARSQQLEALLQELPNRPSVERAATSAAIDAVQTRIQMLDMQLSSTQQSSVDDDQAQRLWSERVQLLNSLVNLRYAEAARSGYWPASTTGAI